MTTLEAITNSVHANYPHLLANNVSVVDYCFWDCVQNCELPVRELAEVKPYLISKGIIDFTLVIFFSDNTIGYRLKI
jgi:hypothetical protein